MLDKTPCTHSVKYFGEPKAKQLVLVSDLKEESHEDPLKKEFPSHPFVRVQKPQALL
jgi:hypothetical protein